MVQDGPLLEAFMHCAPGDPLELPHQVLKDQRDGFRYHAALSNVIRIQRCQHVAGNVCMCELLPRQ